MVDNTRGTDVPVRVHDSWKDRDPLRGTGRGRRRPPTRTLPRRSGSERTAQVLHRMGHVEVRVACKGRQTQSAVLGGRERIVQTDRASRSASALRRRPAKQHFEVVNVRAFAAP
jgi:hypothetical protein